MVVIRVAGGGGSGSGGQGGVGVVVVGWNEGLRLLSWVGVGVDVAL